MSKLLGELEIRTMNSEWNDRKLRLDKTGSANLMSQMVLFGVQ